MDLDRRSRRRMMPALVGCCYVALATGWFSGRAIEASPPDPAAEAVAILRARQLRLPVDGIRVERLKGQFDDPRAGGTRGHEAVDILAPKGTAIRAVEDGTIEKLFTSKAGGLTIYQFDPSGRFCYYYAHLDRYAPGLREKQAVHRGDLIGTVGTTGNAPPDTPHLHFAIVRLHADRHWWEGSPIDPYLVFARPSPSSPPRHGR